MTNIFGAVLGGLAIMGVAVMGATALAGPPAAKPAPVAVEAPTVTNPLVPMYTPFKWGMTHAEVAKAHNQTNGIFDTDYNPQLAKMQPGVKMQALEAERENKKTAFTATYVEFKDQPTGYD